MLKLFAKTTGFIFLLLSFSGIALAGNSVTKNITASIPSQDGLDVHISKVSADSGNWTRNQSSIDFGTLTYDTTNHIFLPSCYYAVDVGVNTNTSNWTVTHNTSSIQGPSGANLDNNVIVTFVKTENTSSGTNDVLLRRTSFANSNGVSYGKSNLNGGWLRIYYGIATGGSNEPSNVKPITMDKPAGNYTGSVTITLTY